MATFDPPPYNYPTGYIYTPTQSANTWSYTAAPRPPERRWVARMRKYVTAKPTVKTGP